jgi:hypothetical protein
MTKAGLERPGHHRPKGRRGNLIVTSFIFVIAMALIMAGLTTMLKEQIRQSADIKGISLGKLQVYYLAEMGVNYWMYTANQNTAAPFPTSAAIGTMNFKNNVAMVRSLANGVATCTASMTPATKVAQGYPQYQMAAHLVTPDGTFDRTVYFDVTHLSGGSTQWALSRYRSQ